MDRQIVGSYLTERFGTEVTITSLVQAFPGHSRETWFISARLGSGSEVEERDLVLRVNPPSGGGVPVPLRVEYEVYKRLWPSPVPVAEPLWYDEDIDYFEGRPHFVRNMVPGHTLIKGLDDPGPQGEALRERIALEHAEKLALLHTLDWREFGLNEVLPVPDSPADSLRLEYDTWRGHWEKGRTDPFPMITEALYWLKDHLPNDTPRISLLKGNNGVGEEIWRDEKIVAFSDWELASLGDACQDWGFTQGMLDIWDAERTLAYYEQKAGFKVSRKTLAFSNVWTIFKIIVNLNSTMNSYLDKRDLRAVIVNQGFGTVKLLERMLTSVTGLDDIEEASRIILNKFASPYQKKRKSSVRGIK
ncbi:phosphotransferase family protein [Thermodesulfobacteriota bacterium]